MSKNKTNNSRENTHIVIVYATPHVAPINDLYTECGVGVDVDIVQCANNEYITIIRPAYSTPLTIIHIQIVITMTEEESDIVARM